MRSRLVLLTGAVTAMVVVAFLIPLALLIDDLAEDRAISFAEREANALARTIAVLGDVDGPTISALIAGADGRVTLSVLAYDGSVIGEDAAPTARSGIARLVAEDGGVAAYAPVVGVASGAEVRGWVGSDELDRNVAASWTVLGILGVLLIALAALLADRLGRSMVRPVVDLAAATEQLGEGDLSVSVEPDGPTELQAVGHAFNRLVQRTRGLLTAERESVADLSHRLRTPLTALRLDVEAGASTDELMESVDRVERAVDSIISEARRPDRTAEHPRADLREITIERVGFWSALAADQGRSVSVDTGDEAVLVAGSPSDVAALLDALIENVLSHTPDGTDYDVSVLTDRSLVVADRGPGVPAEAIDRGVSGAGGTGLGLDIVRRTAEATGGSLDISVREGGGARVVVRFGPATGAR